MGLATYPSTVNHPRTATETTSSRSLAPNPHYSVGKQILFKTAFMIMVVALLGIASSVNNQSTEATPGSSRAATLQLLPDDSSGTNQAQNAQTVTTPAPQAGSNGQSSSSSSDQTSITSSSETSGSSSQSSMSVTVNGQPVSVPKNGNSYKTFTTPDGSTTVTVTNNQSNDGLSSGDNSTTITTHNIQSNSTHNVDIDSNSQSRSP